MPSIERDMDALVEMAMKLDAKKRRDRPTYSKQNRARIVKMESIILNDLMALMATAGGAVAAYALFTRRADLSRYMIEITRAAGGKLEPLKTKLAQILVGTAPSIKRKKPSFFKYLLKFARGRVVDDVFKSYVTGAKLVLGQYAHAAKKSHKTIDRSLRFSHAFIRNTLTKLKK